MIDRGNAKMIDRESDKTGRLIREAIWIRKTDNMNREEGSYQLSHVWDKLLHIDDRQRNVDKQYVIFGCIRVINIVLSNTLTILAKP